MRLVYITPCAQAMFYNIPVGDEAPGPSSRQGRPRKYATVEKDRAARNAARRDCRWEEAAMEETAATTQQDQHESSTEGPTRLSPSHSSVLMLWTVYVFLTGSLSKVYT